MAKNGEVLFSNLGSSPKDKIINIVIIIIAIVALYFMGNFIWKKLKPLFAKQKQDDELSKELSKGVKLTYTDYEYTNMADSLYTAMKGVGTTTSKVYEVFGRMRNRADVLKLDIAFGIRDNESLSQWMQGESLLSISKINDILSARGINYAF